MALAHSARAGDSASVEALIGRMRHIARILAALNVRLGAPLSAEDLADVSQDTAVRAWRKLEHFDGSSSLETWFCGIARRELMNALRRKRKHQSSAELPDAPEPELPGAQVDTERLRLALEKLSGEDARMIFLHHFESLTLEQAARRLGVPLSTAKRRYYRGLGSLQRFLSGRLAAEDS